MKLFRQGTELVDDEGLPPFGWWVLSVPRRIWTRAAAGAAIALLFLLATLHAMSNSASAVDRIEASNSARSESKAISTSIDSVVATVLDAPKDMPTIRQTETIETAKTRINKAIDIFSDAGIDQAPITKLRNEVDTFFATATRSLGQTPTEARSENLERSGRAAAAAATDVSSAIDFTATNAGADADSTLAWAKGLLIAFLLSAMGTGGWTMYQLNKRTRHEVAEVGKVLHELANGELTLRIDAAKGPIHQGLAEPFKTMISGLRTAYERLQVWAQTSNVEKVLTETLGSVRGRADLSAAVGTAFNAVSSTVPMEMMTLSPDATRMLKLALNSEAGSPNCPVNSPRYCPAMQSSTTLRFPDALHPDACPQLRARGVECAAMCVPVKGPRQRIGVIHLTTPTDGDLDDQLRAHMETIADLAGAKLSQVQAFETTWRRATTDQLTGLHNRRAFEDRANELLARKVPFTLVMADLDHFKRLNDTFGHKTGDEVLKAFARVLRENIRRSDTAARFGGEEFLVLLPDISMTESLVTLDRVRMALAPTLAIAGLPKATASFGAVRSEVGQDLERIIRVADAGLYLAKQNGRDRVEVATPSTEVSVFGEVRSLPEG